MPSVARSLVLAAFAAAASVPLAAGAQSLRPAGWFVQGGAGPKDSLAGLSVGAQWPWAWRSGFAGGEFSAATEVFLSAWRADAAGGGHRSYLQAGVVPMFRWTPAQSAWFFEAGIGLSILDKEYVSANRRQGSQWNFSDNFAVGRSFGERNEQEISLRWQHSSNAGIEKPNPGIDLLMVRYTTKF
jgi:lipid A 3-O-deacylase